MAMEMHKYGYERELRKLGKCAAKEDMIIGENGEELVFKWRSWYWIEEDADEPVSSSM